MSGNLVWRQRPSESSSPKMRVLYVLSPSNQMYSGIGRTIFELCRRMSGRVDFEFAMSNYFEKNLAILREFCQTHGFPLHVGSGHANDGSLDTYNDDLPELLRRKRWDAVECICWANAATNEGLLENVGDMVLAYTPHDQPISSVPMSAEQAAHIERVHQRVLTRADVVFCDSPWERQLLQARLPRQNNCTHLSLGCDFELFQSGPLERRQQLLFVGDLAEPRKRFDRVLAVFARLLRRHPALRLIVIGNRSDTVLNLIPTHLRHACTLKGYVSEEELRRTYRESLGLFLLSEYEAFGIPILEALASGTPVFLSRQAATESLFDSFEGAHFCPAEDLEATLAIVEQTIDRGRIAIQEAIDDRPRLQAAFDWDRLAVRKWDALAAAWFVRNAWTRTA